MDIAGIQNGLVGMAIFDMWEAAVKKANKAHAAEHGDPLVAAAAQAFEAYIATAETQHAAQIEGLATYALSPKGAGVQLITAQQMAPFLALNILA